MYLSPVFVLTLIVPYNNPLIASSTGSAAGSPFVAMKRVGVKGFPHIINEVVLTSALQHKIMLLVKVHVICMF